ncbi:MAG: hypothetical protein ACREOF_21610 [Gemmatimonadales bacterium]
MTGGRVPELPPRLRRLLESKRLREQEFTRSDVINLWRRAVESARDAELPGLSLDGSLSSAYDAALNGCQALLAARHLRAAGGQGHHEATFAAVEALGLDGLTDLVPNSEEIRSVRRSSVYDPVLATEADRKKAIVWMRATLPPMRSALVSWDPTLDRDLLPVSRP